MKYIFGFMCIAHVVAIFYVLYTTGEFNRSDLALALVWGAAVDIAILKEKVERLEKITRESQLIRK